jgi:hypothetical protein
MAAFRSLVDQLPPPFRLLSLSGGEPTLSPVFGELLGVLGPLRQSGRFRRVVLTTNGGATSLGPNLDALGRAVTHVNISRHAADDALNAGVFKTDRVPTAGELAALVEQLNRRGVPVNVNCVYSREHAFGRRIAGASLTEVRAEARQFVRFARDLGASSVTFRHDHRDPDLDGPTALEAAFDEFRAVHEARCPSCRVVGKLILGLAVNFKRSAFEPITLHGESELYEMVFHSNGRLYQDWSRRHPIVTPLPRLDGTEQWHQLQGTQGDGPGRASAECDRPQPTCNLMQPA